MKTQSRKPWFFEQPSSEVWNYLSQVNFSALGLKSNHLKPILGHELQCQTLAIPKLTLVEGFPCNVLEVHRREVFHFECLAAAVFEGEVPKALMKIAMGLTTMAIRVQPVKP